MSNQATRLAEEIKRRVEALRVNSQLVESTRPGAGEELRSLATVVAQEADSLVDALLALVQPAVSEEAGRVQDRIMGLVADYGEACQELGYLDDDSKLRAAPTSKAVSAYDAIAIELSVLIARAQSSSKGDEGKQHE